MADDIKKRLKDRRRMEHKEAMQRFRSFPRFNFAGSSATPSYMAVIRAAFDKVRASLVDILLPIEMENVSTFFNATGGRLKQRARARVFCAINKIGDAAYEHVMKTYSIPVGTYQFKLGDRPGQILVDVASFSESKSQHGIRYLANSKPIIVSDDTGVKIRQTMVYTRHFLERAMERDFLGSPLERHRSLFRCLDNNVVLVPAGKYYRLYANSSSRLRSLDNDLRLPQQLAGTVDGSALYHFLGYVPITIEDGLFVTKTLLLPGMSDTPEGDMAGLGAGHFLDKEYLSSLAEIKFPIGLLVNESLAGGKGRYSVRTLDISSFADEADKRNGKPDEEEDADVPSLQVEKAVGADRRTPGAPGGAPISGARVLRERRGEAEKHAGVD